MITLRSAVGVALYYAAGGLVLLAERVAPWASAVPTWVKRVERDLDADLEARTRRGRP